MSVVLFLFAVVSAVGFVTASLTVRRLRTQLASLQKESCPAAVLAPGFDAVTGLPDRRRLDDVLHGRRNRETDQPGDMGIVVLDLADFGALNDSLGRDAGDHALANVADRLRIHVRAQETLARLDGDRFAVVLEEPVTRASALRAASRLMDAIREPLEVDGVDVVLQAHGGVAIGPRLDAHKLVDDAEIALTRAKSERSLLPLVYHVEHRREACDAFHQAQHLRNALSGGEFDVVYQPIHRYSDGRLTAFEALLRWHSATLGSVSPAEFIPLAEGSGAIVEIGAWVLDRACEDLSWICESTGRPDLAVSVNVSAHQLRKSGFASVVRDALERHGLSVEQLQLEITESILAIPEEVGPELDAIVDLGVPIALDDVGSGYSSLAQLTALPIESIKLDRSLIQAVDRRLDGAKSILTSLASLGRSLSLEVVVEGVETEAQSAIARAAGCSHEQGFLRSRPLPFDEIVEYTLRAPGSPVVPTQA